MNSRDYTSSTTVSSLRTLATGSHLEQEHSQSYSLDPKLSIKIAAHPCSLSAFSPMAGLPFTNFRKGG